MADTGCESVGAHPAGAVSFAPAFLLLQLPRNGPLARAGAASWHAMLSDERAQRSSQHYVKVLMRV